MAHPIPLCDDVLEDVLYFVKREEHARANMVSRRFNWWSTKVSRRFPARICARIDVEGSIDGNNIINVHHPHPSSTTQIFDEFPDTEPPEDILKFDMVELRGFIGPELFSFLRLSSRLFDNCCLVFEDFTNFVQFHSTDFIVRFFALFPPNNRTGTLSRVSAPVAPLFIDRPEMFSAELCIWCFEDFPLECLLGWLHLEGKRCLQICFEHNVDVVDRVLKMEAFVQLVRQDFLASSRACPFEVEMVPKLEGGPIPELELFEEHNADTGERLTLTREHEIFYTLKRAEEAPNENKVVSNGQEMGEKRPVVRIFAVHQGDIIP